MQWITSNSGHDWQPWEYPEKACIRCWLISSLHLTECPGKTIPIGLLAGIEAGTVDFRNGKWGRVTWVELTEDELPEGYYANE